MPKIVQCLVRHSARHRSIANNGNDVSAIDRLSCVARNCKSVGVAQHRTGVAVFNEVVNAFFATRVSGNSVCLTQLVKPSTSARNDFVNVCLVPRVPQNCITRRIKHSVERKSQFNGSKV